MSTKENKAVIRRIFDEFNKGNLDVLDQYLANNFVRHGVCFPDMDQQAYKQMNAGMGLAHCTVD